MDRPQPVPRAAQPTSARDAPQRLPSVSPAPRTAVDAVEARDRAILAFLKDGAASYPAVLAAVAEEDGWSDAQRSEACTLALRRLCLKQLVVKAGDAYMLSMATR
jgi:hypothetical protein